MKKRLLFHLLNFLAFNLLVFLAVYLYYALNYPIKYVFYCTVIAYDFIVGKLYNFIMVSLLTYFSIYIGGLIKYTIEDKFFRMVGYFREMVKFFLILAMASFVEFFVFYNARIGRLVYVYIFVLYGLYYLVYRWVRSDKGPRSVLWLASAPAETVLNRYIRKPENYRVFREDDLPEETGPEIQVVYQDGNLDDHTSEALIKNKLAGHTVVELVELVEKEAAKIPLDYVNLSWFLEKFDVVDRNYFRSSRMFNIFMSIILLILLFPLGLIVALVHRCFSEGPLFFVQERIGLHGKPFKLIKFRTMIRDAEKAGAQFAQKNDHRVTPMGKVMRRLRLDEIPQLLNVLKGNMSMVGPRPERGVFIDSLSIELPYYRLRLLVPPGLTGWAQVNGVYAGNDIDDHKEKLEYDLYYIKNRNLPLDLMILLRTIKTILQAKGE